MGCGHTNLCGEEIMSLFEKIEWLDEERDACESELERIADECHAMGNFEEAIDALELLLESRELKCELGSNLRRSA
jgi:hypothetical protein